MSRFAILLGGEFHPTARARLQIANARVIAADSGIRHSEALGVLPELWVGDWDSTDKALAARYQAVERRSYSPDKDATDGEIAIRAARSWGATGLVLVGGLGGETDHTLGILGGLIALARDGIEAMATSGTEEAWPLLEGPTALEVPPGSRFSFIPFADVTGLDLENVKWPLSKRDVPVGSSLTLSNVALGAIQVGIGAGYGIAIVRPAG